MFVLEMLDVNLLEFSQSEWTRVRFYPNGTSDEMTVVFHVRKGGFRKITLEPTTGLADAKGLQEMNRCAE